MTPPPETPREALEMEKSCLLCGGMNKPSVYSATKGCFVCVECAKRVPPPTDEYPARMVNWDSPEGFMVIRRGFYEQELRVVKDQGRALGLQQATEAHGNPAADGCSGVGRPSCKAAECMFGLDKHLNPKRWSCAFTDEVIPELSVGLCQLSDEYAAVLAALRPPTEPQ